MKRTLDLRVALIGTALLAADPAFVLTTRWDWGPVTIQHLCLVGCLLSIVRFSENGRLMWLALGFCVFGVGLWDKALFVWSLIGVGVATDRGLPSTNIQPAECPYDDSGRAVP